MKGISHVVIISCLTAFTSCSSCISITPPNIVITGERTAIERQITGEYQELEKDAWIVASAPTSVNRTGSDEIAAGGDPELLRALKVREFHKEKIRAYKDEGALGEGYDGYVAYIKNSRYENDSHNKELLMKLVSEENLARKTIFLHGLIQGGKTDPGPEDLAEFGRAFAVEQAALVRKNDWIQDKNGIWSQKK
jgi:hypothetical protein